MATAQCAAALDAWCGTADAACPHATHGPMFARYSSSARPSAGLAWRCYAQDALDDARREYSQGQRYCTRHAQLAEELQQCQAEAERSRAPPQHATVHANGRVHEGGATREPAVPDGPEMDSWEAAHVVTLDAVDTSTWEPTLASPLLRVASWRVPCIDDLHKHKLRNYTGNVSRRKAFLSREGLRCTAPEKCVRGVVDGFATHDEIGEMRVLGLDPPPGQTNYINTWRWDVPPQPAAFRRLVVRAQTILHERFGVGHLRFYRSNIITWQGAEGNRKRWPKEPAPWLPRSLHGDTNTDEMFIYTTILYLSQHGADVIGGETGIADSVEAGDDGGTVSSGLRVQPSVGRLLVFSAGAENMHEMLPVTHGKRVAIQMWFACDGMGIGWADPQREAWEATHGWGGPDGGPMGREGVEPAPPLSDGLVRAFRAGPWPWSTRHW